MWNYRYLWKLYSISSWRIHWLNSRKLRMSWPKLKCIKAAKHIYKAAWARYLRENHAYSPNTQILAHIIPSSIHSAYRKSHSNARCRYIVSEQTSPFTWHWVLCTFKNKAQKLSNKYKLDHSQLIKCSLIKYLWCKKQKNNLP